MREKVFLAADRLALQLGGVDRVSVRDVLDETGGAAKRVASFVKEWKAERLAEATDVPSSLSTLAKHFAAQAFVLGQIYERLRWSKAGGGPASSGGDPNERLEALAEEVKALRTELAERPADERPSAAPGGGRGDKTIAPGGNPRLSKARTDHGGDDARSFLALVGKKADRSAQDNTPEAGAAASAKHCATTPTEPMTAVAPRETPPPKSNARGFLAVPILVRKPPLNRKPQAEPLRGHTRANAPSSKRHLRQVERKIWRDAENPEFAKDAAEKLIATGYPLGHTELSKLLDPMHRYFKMDKAYREITAALKGSGLVLGPKSRWWFENETPPERPKQPKYTRLKTHLSRKRVQGKKIFEGVLGFLKSSPAPMSVAELYEKMLADLDPPRRGRFNKEWLRQLLKRREKADPQLIKSYSKYRWTKRPRG